MGEKTVTSAACFFFFCASLYSSTCHGILNDTVHIGVILDNNSWVGKVAKTAIEVAADDVNNDAHFLNGTRLLLHLRHAQTLLDAAAAAVDLLKREVVAIIGPQTYEVAEFVSRFGDEAKVPIVSFTLRTPLLPNDRFSYLVGVARSDGLQMKAIATLVSYYGWRRIIFIHPDDYFGLGAAALLSDALRDVGSEIEYRSAISPTADNKALREQLYKLKTMDTKVFVAHIPSDLGLSLFREAQEIGMMSMGYVWITTDWFTSVWDVLINASAMTSVQGLLGVKTHIRNSNELINFTQRWKRQFTLANSDMYTDTAKLNPQGLLAYDTVLIIARAIGNLGINTTLNFLKPSNPPTVIRNAELKSFQQGKQLLQEIIGSNFTGLGGPIELGHGEMSEFIYEIVNMVGKSYQVVGYWTDKLPSKLSTTLPSNGNEGLGTVFWPSGSAQTPRGWVMPTCGKRLQMGVPIKNGWKELVNAIFNPDLNKSEITGFCIDVFDAVLKELEYGQSYDLVPCADDGTSTNSYDHLIHQVHLEKFDGVLGDTTILASRSKIVDFTNPYSDSGFVMVVPIGRNGANRVWVVFQPFTPQLWCAMLVFTIFTGAVVRLLEADCFSGGRSNTSQEVVITPRFGFARLVFPHREKATTPSTRMVHTVWLLVVLIMTSSYTASLSSILIEEQIKHTRASVEAVVASGAPVGYQKGSFVADYLHNNLGIAKTSLKAYETPEEYEEALSNGPNKGGVAAIFDEIPYVRLFLSGRCGYSTVGPIYKTGGWGFVFSKGSPLVRDISRAILNLSESTALQLLEAKYFNITPNCSDSRADSNFLIGAGSFWGLFLISSSVYMLMICLQLKNIIGFTEKLDGKHKVVSSPLYKLIYSLGSQWEESDDDEMLSESTL